MVNIPQVGDNKTGNGIHKFLAAGLLAATLTLGFSEQANAQAPQTQTNMKGLEATKRTVDEMQTRIVSELLEGDKTIEAKALDQARSYIDNGDIKIIDNLVAACDEGRLSKGTAKGAIYLLICKKYKQPILRNRIQVKIKDKWYTEKDLQDIIDISRATASLRYIKK